MNDSTDADSTLEVKFPSAKGAKPHSFSRRLAAVLTTAVLLVSVVTIAVLYIGAIRDQEADLIKNADEYRDYLVGALELPLWSYDETTISAICRTFSQNKLVVGVVLKDASGSTIHAISKSHEPEVLIRKGKIYHQGALLGEIELSLTKQLAQDTERKLLMTYMRTMLIVSISLVLLTYLFVRILLRKPIDALEQMVRPYADGIYNQPIPILPYQEFQTFGATLARMGETIRAQIDELRSSHRHLEESEERMRLFFERQLVGMAITSPEKGWVQVNDRLCQIMGYSREELLHLTWAEMTYPEDLEPDLVQFNRLLAGEIEDYMMEKRFVRKDGSIVHTALAVGCVRKEDRTVNYVLALLEDITNRKQAEEELQRYKDHLEEIIQDRTQELALARDEAQSANKAKSMFLANMSHELRTPLNAVLGFSQLMKNAPDVTSKHRKYLDIITHSGEYLLSLINNVLDISKIESGIVALDESHIDLYQLLEGIKSLMYVQAAAKGLTLTLEQSPDLSRHIIVDGSKLRQVLVNLIGNAIKYTTRGGIIVRAMMVTKEDSVRMQVRFEVVDSGPGIREEDRSQIFTSFLQLVKHRPPETGTGLGLAICKQYVELMGGQIGVAGKPGKGSIFYFEIPATRLPAEAIPAAARHGRVLGLEQGQPRYRLLIVEDQPENRLLLHKLLEPFDFDLREAVNGQEGVALFEEWHPHLVWMDIRMPVMDGLEATRQIKATDIGAHTPIIAITAHALEGERSEILAAGCDDFIRKPYEYTAILDALTRHLGVRFVYEEEKTPAAVTTQLNAAALSALPDELLNRLEHALRQIDTSEVKRMIEEIRANDPSLADALATVAKDFKYGKILRLIQDAHNENLREDET